MSATARFHIVYDGPALEQHLMDVRELAPALFAIGDVVERANEILNGDKAKISLQVKASFKTGSFGVELHLVQHWLQAALGMVNGPVVTGVLSLAELLSLVGAGSMGAIKLIQWLRGRGIRKVEPLENGNVRVFVDDEQIEVEEKVIRLIQDYKLRKSLEDLIAVPLRRDGITTFAVASDDAKNVVVMVEKRDSKFFAAPDPTERVLQDQTFETNLQILNVAFQDSNKWRFSDGASSFHATVVDTNFNDRVKENHEYFARDDILRVLLRRLQKQGADGLKTEYEVTQVLEHRSAAPQVQLEMPLDFDDREAGDDRDEESDRIDDREPDDFHDPFDRT
jgi:hypothetical protein